MNSLKEPERLDQSVWLYGFRHDLLSSGKLKSVIDDYGVSGIIGDLASRQNELRQGAYDPSIAAALERSPELDVPALLETLLIEDVALAAEICHPIYVESDGRNGLVSVDLNPHLAYDTVHSVREARRLWTMLGRENVMVKIPATAEGVAAIELLTAEGIPVNATLIFSVSQYEAVAEAYLRGRKRTHERRPAHAVASFPVIEIDRAIDRALEEVASEEALSLTGKAAVATAALANLRFRQMFHRLPTSKSEHSRAVRPVWVIATPEREVPSIVRYMEALLAEETTCATWLEALEAFGERGQREAGLQSSEKRAEEILGALLKMDINLRSVGQELTDEAVETLEQSYDDLVRTLAERRAVVAPERPA